MADVHGPTATRTTSWHWSLLRDSVPHEFPPSEAADLRDWPKHRSSCSTAKEDRAAATVMFGSALPAIDPLPNRSAISKAPRAAGYRGSDFVLWHQADYFRTAAIPSAIRRFADVHDMWAASGFQPDPNSMQSRRVL